MTTSRALSSRRHEEKPKKTRKGKGEAETMVTKAGMMRMKIPLPRDLWMPYGPVQKAGKSQRFFKTQEPCPPSLNKKSSW